MKEKIEPKKWYSLNKLFTMKVFDGVDDKRMKSYVTVYRLLLEDNIDKKILNPIITGEGRGRKISIKGSNVIKFLKSKK